MEQERGTHTQGRAVVAGLVIGRGRTFQRLQDQFLDEGGDVLVADDPEAVRHGRMTDTRATRRVEVDP